MIDIPPLWQQTADNILLKKGVVIVIGLPNSGKSTFVKFLASYGVKNNLKVAIINSDLGQADIGVPGTISLSLLENEPLSFENLPIKNWYFIGEITPTGKFLQVITGVRRLLDEAKKMADIVIINTCGLVKGRLGKILKYYKTFVIDPDHIVAIQTDNELDPLLKIIGRLSKNVYKIPKSILARERPPEERREFREKRYEMYFQNAKTLLFPIYLVHSIDKYIDFQKEDYTGRLVGLIDEKENLLELGIIQEVNLEKRNLLIFTPLKEIDKVKRIEIGSIKLKVIREI
ncbi:MAG: Clp1/GlmU family protein [Dictyoglomus thermophilum]|nr:Clp1/GlmU family protein [Dictyoglomus thermophilum]MCX7721138.1 Clp1/GlmU family protein [Dictyoglomus thermophilum]